MAFSHASTFAIAKEEVAIALMPGAFGSHIGIVFHTAKDGIQLLHLRFHHQLATDVFPPEGGCIASCLPMPPLASKQVIGIIRAIAKRKPKIPYGIDFIRAKNSFDGTGKYAPPRGSTGLTCATFITEVFRAAAVPLIDEGSWEYGDENVAWGEQVVALLKKCQVPADHIVAVEASINGLRVRPEEVGATCEFPFRMRPVKYKDISQKTNEVMQYLKCFCEGH